VAITETKQATRRAEYLHGLADRGLAEQDAAQAERKERRKAEEAAAKEAAEAEAERSRHRDARLVAVAEAERAAKDLAAAIGRVLDEAAAESDAASRLNRPTLHLYAKSIRRRMARYVSGALRQVADNHFTFGDMRLAGGQPCTDWCRAESASEFSWSTDEGESNGRQESDPAG
jgi:hypothetical protein